MAQLIDGKQISKEIKDELKTEVQKLKSEGKNVCLAVVQVGDDPASTVYVNNKKKACAYIGIESRSYELPESTSEEELTALVEELNEDDGVNGILVQLPLPSHIDEDRIIRTISPDKDVDGFHPVSVGRLWIGEKGFLSCTPAGIIQLLKRSNIEIAGKNCVIIGRSNIVESRWRLCCSERMELSRLPTRRQKIFRKLQKRQISLLSRSEKSGLLHLIT